MREMKESNKETLLNQNSSKSGSSTSSSMSPQLPLSPMCQSKSLFTVITTSTIKADGVYTPFNYLDPPDYQNSSFLQTDNCFSSIQHQSKLEQKKPIQYITRAIVKRVQ